MTLRSVKNKVLDVPFTKSKIYERGFSIGFPGAISQNVHINLLKRAIVFVRNRMNVYNTCFYLTICKFCFP